jgi:hypothetical protein
LVVYADGRLAYTLTGFAEDVHGKFKTRIWLAEALCEAGSGARGIDEAVDEFATAASADVAKMRFQTADARKLTIAFAGYAIGPLGNDRAVLRLVSNFESFNGPPLAVPRREFAVSAVDVALDPGGPHPICIVPIGAVSPRDRKLRPLVDALATSVSPTAAIDTAVEIIRAESTPDGPIGNWCSSVLLPRQGNQSAMLDYHPGEPRQIHRLPTFVYRKHDDAGAFILAESRVEGTAHSGASVTRVPKVGRHQPCPCGSKRRFKDCHGRKKITQKMASIHGHFDVKFKLLPSEDVDLFKIASNAIHFGPEGAGALATVSGAPPFVIRRRPPKSA